MKKRIICLFCAVCVCFSCWMMPIVAQMAEIEAEMSYYPGLTETTKDEADVIRYDLTMQTEKYYKISDPTYGSVARTTEGWFPLGLLNNEFISEQISAPNAIIGNDDRVLVENPSLLPYSAIALTTLRYPDYVAKEYVDSWGTGSMIGRDVLLTAAHCIYDHSADTTYEGWVERVKVDCGYNGETGTSVASTWGRYIFVSPRWVDGGDTRFDWAIVLTVDAVGSTTGWFSVHYNDDEIYDLDYAIIVGYPGDKQALTGMWQQYIHTERITNVPSSYFVYYDIDATAGQSGAPVCDTNFRIIAIHTRGKLNNDIVTSNEGVRITNALFDIIEALLV